MTVSPKDGPPHVVVLNPHPYFQPYTLERAAAERLGASFHADGPPDAALLAQATVLLSHSAPMDRAFFEQVPACQLVVSYSTGTDHMDVEAARERGIDVHGVAGYCTEDVAEHALAMILACARALFPLDRAWQRDRFWNVTVTAPRRRRLSQQTLGIVGVGRIGRALGVKAAALGMRVLGYDPYLDAAPADFPGTLVSLEALLRESDYVSLHAPFTGMNQQLIGAPELALMKPTAYLINNARGSLVDEVALGAALDAGQLAGAALDVREQEPAPLDDPLAGRDNVVLTPHAAAFSVDSIADLRSMVVGYMEDALGSARA